MDLVLLILRKCKQVKKSKKVRIIINRYSSMSTESEEIKPIEPIKPVETEQLTEEEEKQKSIKHLKDTYKEQLTEDDKTNFRKNFPTNFKNKGNEEGEKEGEEEGEKEGEEEGEKAEEEEKHFETMGDLLALLMTGFIKGYALGKVTLLESIFYATIMPVLVTGGADEDSIITILSFLKNPNITPEEIVDILDKQHKSEEEKIAHLDKIGDVLTKTTQAFGLAALKGANPKVKTIMTELNESMKTKILPAIIKAQQKLQKTAADASKTGTEPKIETKKGGAPSKKINKTKMKQRIHNSIKKFYKTNNLKTLKREIQRMKKRFTRGLKK